jgi:hypothetical protein
MVGEIAKDGFRQFLIELFRGFQTMRSGHYFFLAGFCSQGTWGAAIQQNR